MRSVFEQGLKDIHDDLIRMGSVVEKQIYVSVESLVKHDVDMADKIIKDDDIVDNMQKKIEDQCIRLIAMQQPIATDLRSIFTTIKVVTDLERMADYAVDISKVTKKLAHEKYIKKLIDIPKFADIAVDMVKKSLDSYVENDVDKAYSACRLDDEMDALYKQVFNELLVLMMEDPKSIKQATQFLFICKYLERASDHATNICEWTIYHVKGEQVDLNE